MYRPSRGFLESVTTTRKNGRFRAPARFIRMTTAIPEFLRGVTPSRPAAPLAQPHRELAAPAAAKALQHRLRLLEAPEQPIDVLHRGAAAPGDPLAAAPVDDRRALALFARHRPDDRLRSSQLALVDSGVRRQLDPGQHLDQLLERPQLLHLLKLLEE